MNQYVYEIAHHNDAAQQRGRASGPISDTCVLKRLPRRGVIRRLAPLGCCTMTRHNSAAAQAAR